MFAGMGHIIMLLYKQGLLVIPLEAMERLKHVGVSHCPKIFQERKKVCFDASRARARATTMLVGVRHISDKCSIEITIMFLSISVASIWCTKYAQMQHAAVSLNALISSLGCSE